MGSARTASLLVPKCRLRLLCRDRELPIRRSGNWTTRTLIPTSRSACSRGIFSEGLIEREPNSTTKLAMDAQDQKLLESEVFSPMREIRGYDQSKDSKSLCPTCHVPNAPTLYFRRCIEYKPAIQEQLRFGLRTYQISSQEIRQVHILAGDDLSR